MENSKYAKIEINEPFDTWKKIFEKIINPKNTLSFKVIRGSIHKIIIELNETYKIVFYTRIGSDFIITIYKNYGTDNCSKITSIRIDHDYYHYQYYDHHQYDNSAFKLAKEVWDYYIDLDYANDKKIITEIINNLQ